MYEVIGHEGVRDRLKGFEGSFAVLGPKGVGKAGIAAEWAKDKDLVRFDSLDIDQARRLSAACYSTSTSPVLIDGDCVSSWNPLLRPIEDGFLKAAVWATDLDPVVASRLETFSVGYLSEAEVLKILAKSYPTFGPRPWLAKALMGHFDGFDDKYAAIHVFENVDACLADRVFPRSLVQVPFAVYCCVRLACAAKLGVSNLPWGSASLSSIPDDAAWQVLRLPYPAAKNEARNIATLFFGSVTGGRLG